MEWEQKLADADEALAEFGTSDEEIEAICLAAAERFGGDLAGVDYELEMLADGQVSISPAANWEEDADTTYAPVRGPDAEAYAELQQRAARDIAEGEAVTAAPEAYSDPWEDGNEGHTMIADIIEGEDGEFVLMVEEDDLEVVDDDSGIEPVEGAPEDKTDKSDKSLLKRLFSRG